ncbi:MAG TPA: hypothetical protein VKE72_00955 [Methylocella sp.]|nr:hypothetical protein [Methylocella sp.]
MHAVYALAVVVPTGADGSRRKIAFLANIFDDAVHLRQIRGTTRPSERLYAQAGGVLAPVVAIAYARDKHNNGDLVAAWNQFGIADHIVFGIADLIVAVTAGFSTFPSPLQLFALEAPNELISVSLLALVPVFLVPASVLLHFASLAGMLCGIAAIKKSRVLRRDAESCRRRLRRRRGNDQGR